MKGRQLLIILGCVCVLLVVIIVGLAVWTIHTVEQERNRLKTRAASAGRWPDKDKERKEEPTTEGNDKPADQGASGGDQGSGS